MSRSPHSSRPSGSTARPQARARPAAPHRAAPRHATPRHATPRRPAAQLDLALSSPPCTHGGKRERAGRKPTGLHRGDVPHARRPCHDAPHPVHVTLRAARGVPNLRGHTVARALGRAFRAAATSTRLADRRRRETFRVIHLSLQPDHVHLVVEATSALALSRGLQGLASRLARKLNVTTGHTGQVFRFRYHARPLATPREVRSAIAYVLTNFRKHLPLDADGEPVLGARRGDPLDPWSSAHWFDGWTHPLPPQAKVSPVAHPRTWLARVGWRRHGPISVVARPAG